MAVRMSARSLERICKRVYRRTPAAYKEQARGCTDRAAWGNGRAGINRRRIYACRCGGKKMDRAGTSCHILLTAMSQPHPLYIAIPHPTLPTPGRGRTAYLRVFMTVCEPSARRTRLITMPRVCPRDTELRVSILRPERS